ncbi:MAG: hypothetical protein QOF77_430 [Solirubrobacteraceae bacterium]|nr:hypothetical protein [Solirubrobacteraceae bacterium]
MPKSDGHTRQTRGTGLAPPPGRDATAKTPERSLLHSIAAGEIDAHLPALAQAIHARLNLLHTINSIDALAQLVVGDRVRINHHVRPRYLEGLHGAIIALDTSTATVRLQRPVGRFTTGEIRCPPLALERVAPDAA